MQNARSTPALDVPRSRGCVDREGGVTRQAESIADQNEGMVDHNGCVAYQDDGARTLSASAAQTPLSRSDDFEHQPSERSSIQYPPDLDEHHKAVGTTAGSLPTSAAFRLPELHPEISEAQIQARARNLDNINVDADGTDEAEVVIIDRPLPLAVQGGTKPLVETEDEAGFLADKTNFSFVDHSVKAVRTKPFSQCDTVGKLFSQAIAARILRSGADQHTISARINEDVDIIFVFRGDQEDFDNLINAIENHPCWRLKGKGATCRVEVGLCGD